MIYLTIFMLIVSLVSVVKGGLFVGYRKKIHELFEEDELTGKLVPKEDADEDEVNEYGFYSLLVIVFSFAYVILLYSFLINAMVSVDVYVLPSALWLTYNIGDLVLTLSGHKKKKSFDESIKDTFWKKTVRFLFLVYVVYILILLLL